MMPLTSQVNPPLPKAPVIGPGSGLVSGSQEEPQRRYLFLPRKLAGPNTRRTPQRGHNNGPIAGLCTFTSLLAHSQTQRWRERGAYVCAGTKHTHTHTNNNNTSYSDCSPVLAVSGALECGAQSVLPAHRSLCVPVLLWFPAGEAGRIRTHEPTLCACVCLCMCVVNESRPSNTNLIFIPMLPSPQGGNTKIPLTEPDDSVFCSLCAHELAHTQNAVTPYFSPYAYTWQTPV